MSPQSQKMIARAIPARRNHVIASLKIREVAQAMILPVKTAARPRCLRTSLARQSEMFSPKNP